MKSIFWISAGLTLYTYAVYPVLLLMLASLRQAWTDLDFALHRRNHRRVAPPAFSPSVSLVFAAYNEEQVMARKMANCAALDYPAGRLEILVGCDGCTDRTVELARAANLGNARIFDFRERSGKLSILNRLLEQARGEIVVFSDASSFLEEGSVRSLLRHFADPAVGCVCGELRLFSPGGAPLNESVYWRYEVFLKFLESRLDLLLGANGGVYAIRRTLFRPLPRQAIIDDFLVAMNVRSVGERLAYDPEAVAWEEAAPTTADEFRRRVRIGAGAYHALRFTLPLLSPLAGRVAFSYWSHKVFRWLVPFALPLAFFAALASSGEAFYAASAAALALLFLTAAAGYALERRRVLPRALSLPYYFVAMNLALLLGFVRFLTDSQGSTWERTARSEQAAVAIGGAGAIPGKTGGGTAP